MDRLRTSGELAQMRAAMAEKTNLVDRHLLLKSLVDQAYKRYYFESNCYNDLKVPTAFPKLV